MKRTTLTLLALALSVATGRAAQSEAARQTPVDALKQKLDAGEKVLVIDVRSDDEVKSGSIPGAIHIPLEQLESRMKEIPKDVELVFT
jgi:rhodanese-related sulfurtransferase